MAIKTRWGADGGHNRSSTQHRPSSRVPDWTTTRLSSHSSRLPLLTNCTGGYSFQAGSEALGPIEESLGHRQPSEHGLLLQSFLRNSGRVEKTSRPPRGLSRARDINNTILPSPFITYYITRPSPTLLQHSWADITRIHTWSAGGMRHA
jgi:hypothetical protein